MKDTVNGQPVAKAKTRIELAKKRSRVIKRNLGTTTAEVRNVGVYPYVVRKVEAPPRVSPFVEMRDERVS